MSKICNILFVDFQIFRKCFPHCSKFLQNKLKEEERLVRAFSNLRFFLFPLHCCGGLENNIKPYAQILIVVPSYSFSYTYVFHKMHTYVHIWKKLNFSSIYKRFRKIVYVISKFISNIILRSRNQTFHFLLFFSGSKF